MKLRFLALLFSLCFLKPPSSFSQNAITDFWSKILFNAGYNYPVIMVDAGHFVSDISKVRDTIYWNTRNGKSTKAVIATIVEAKSFDGDIRSHLIYTLQTPIYHYNGYASTEPVNVVDIKEYKEIDHLEQTKKHRVKQLSQLYPSLNLKLDSITKKYCKNVPHTAYSEMTYKEDTLFIFNTSCVEWTEGYLGKMKLSIFRLSQNGLEMIYKDTTCSNVSRIFDVNRDGNIEIMGGFGAQGVSSNFDIWEVVDGKATTVLNISSIEEGMETEYYSKHAVDLILDK